MSELDMYKLLGETLCILVLLLIPIALVIWSKHIDKKSKHTDINSDEEDMKTE